MLPEDDHFGVRVRAALVLGKLGDVQAVIPFLRCYLLRQHSRDS
ncbi:MAG: hypothetical protein ACE5R6_13635 [Candidatus Heimdallarchaeota archaeon]